MSTSRFLASARAAGIAVVAVAGLVTLTGCGGDEGGRGDAGSETATSTATVEVLALDNLFEPERLTVAAGTAVVWRNAGLVYHNIVPEQEGYGFEVDQTEFDVGDSYRFVFTAPGTYRYYCSIHGTIDVGMIGTVTVTA